MTNIKPARFSSCFYFYPFTTPAKPSRTILRVISIALMIFTLGITHLLVYVWYKNRNIHVLPKNPQDKPLQQFQKTFDKKQSISDLDEPLPSIKKSPTQSKDIQPPSKPNSSDTPSKKEERVTLVTTSETEHPLPQLRREQDPLQVVLSDNHKITENPNDLNVTCFKPDEETAIPAEGLSLREMNPSFEDSRAAFPESPEKIFSESSLVETTDKEILPKSPAKYFIVNQKQKIEKLLKAFYSKTPKLKDLKSKNEQQFPLDNPLRTPSQPLREIPLFREKIRAQIRQSLRSLQKFSLGKNPQRELLNNEDLTSYNIPLELSQLKDTGNTKLKEYQYLNKFSKMISKKLSKADNFFKQQLEQTGKAQIQINGQPVNLIQTDQGEIYGVIPENMGGHIGKGDFKNVEFAICVNNPKKNKAVFAILIGEIQEEEIHIQEALLSDGVSSIAKIHAKGSIISKQGTVDSVSVMKYYHKGTLEDKMNDLSLSQKKVITLKLAICMQEMHKRNVFYRDFKLENILLDENNDPILADFGTSEAYGFLGEKTSLGPKGKEKAQKADVIQFGEMLKNLFEGNNHPEIKALINRMTAELEERILAEDIAKALQELINPGTLGSSD